MRLETVFQVDTGRPVAQCRAVPVGLGGGGRGILCAYSAAFDVDPYVEMFFYPEDSLHLMMLDTGGQVLWQRDLGPDVVPGVWFCPVLAFDLDGDGAEEIWFVDNESKGHPLGASGYRLACLDARTGERLHTMEWPHIAEGKTQPLGQQFRNFIVGGHAQGRPVLVTAQGTYRDMFFEGFGPNLAPLWSAFVPAGGPGAQGSHMCPVLDLNGDGTDELLWGERCFELAGGKELFCADRDSYNGHSDIIAPVRTGEDWRLFVCRESDDLAAPRICCYSAGGERLWGHLERGHIDMGWAARLAPGGGHQVMGIRIGKKVCGADGRYHDRYEVFSYDMDGRPVQPVCDYYKTLPVDLDGDGLHELVRGMPAADGAVFDRAGSQVGTVGGSVALSGKLLDAPGEQLLSYGADGYIRMWRDAEAKDSALALERYAHPFYRQALAVQGNGYNWGLLGGI